MNPELLEHLLNQIQWDDSSVFELCLAIKYSEDYLFCWLVYILHPKCSYCIVCQVIPIWQLWECYRSSCNPIQPASAARYCTVATLATKQFIESKPATPFILKGHFYANIKLHCSLYLYLLWRPKLWYLYHHHPSKRHHQSLPGNLFVFSLQKPHFDQERIMRVTMTSASHPKL